MRYQHQVTIDSPISRVFDYMDDVDREAEWQPGIREAFKEPPGETTVGTRKRYVSEFMGRRIENVYVTRTFVPYEHVCYETTPESVLRATVDLRFEAVETGTRVTMRVDGRVTGALRFLPNSVLEGVFRKELQTSLGLLKERLEGGV